MIKLSVSPPLFIILRSLIFWHKLWCLFQSISFLRNDSILAILSSSSSFCVCHTEYIVSYNSPVNSTVAWDWVSIPWCLVPWLLNSVEDFQCIILTLSFWGLCTSLARSNIEECLLVLLKLLLLDNFISFFSWNTEEFIDCLWGNRLLQMSINYSLTFWYES
jgi:hypothetical protein